MINLPHLPLPGICLSAELHVYDKEKNYVPFDAAKEEPMFAIQRKLIPN